MDFTVKLIPKKVCIIKYIAYLCKMFISIFYGTKFRLFQRNIW